MQSALIVHSKHTKKYAVSISKKYGDVSFLVVSKPPTANITKVKTGKDVVIGVGGGSVIDTAKIIAKNKSIIAIPTTAAGAAITSYATVWLKNKKISVNTKRPKLKFVKGISKNLPVKLQKATMMDALSHAIESYWSVNSTPTSKKYSRKSIKLVREYLKKGNTDLLIEAGNAAGKAIDITKTNVIHAASYPLTISYGVDHSTACALLLPYFVEYMDFKGLPKLFGLKTTESLVKLLKRISVRPRIKPFNPKIVAEKIMKYDRIKCGPKAIDLKALKLILKEIAN